MSKKQVTILLELDSSLRRKLKIKAAKNNITMKKLITDLIQQWVK